MSQKLGHMILAFLFEKTNYNVWNVIERKITHFFYYFLEINNKM